MCCLEKNVIYEMMALISYYLKSFQKISQVGSCCIISEASSICETAVIFFTQEQLLK